MLLASFFRAVCSSAHLPKPRSFSTTRAGTWPSAAASHALAAGAPVPPSPPLASEAASAGIMPEAVAARRASRRLAPSSSQVGRISTVWWRGAARPPAKLPRRLAWFVDLERVQQQPRERALGRGGRRKDAVCHDGEPPAHPTLPQQRRERGARWCKRQ
eukprot:scaffold16223_cov27-Tisochrysis_lutea.AAC.3